MNNQDMSEENNRNKKATLFLRNESEESGSDVMKTANDSTGEKSPKSANGSPGEKSSKLANGNSEDKMEANGEVEVGESPNSTNGDLEEKTENTEGNIVNESVEHNTLNGCSDQITTKGDSEHKGTELHVDVVKGVAEKQAENAEPSPTNGNASQEITESTDQKTANGDTEENTRTAEEGTTHEVSEKKIDRSELDTSNEKKENGDGVVEKSATNRSEKALIFRHNTDTSFPSRNSTDVSFQSRVSTDMSLVMGDKEKSNVENKNTIVGTNVPLHEMPNPAIPEEHRSSKPEEHLNSLIKNRDNKRLKQWLRSHHWSINHPIRGNLWLKTCKYLHKWQSNIYDEIVEDLFRDGPPETLALPQFVDQSHLHHYYLTPTGVHTVHIIMVVLENLNPDITFSPTLFPIAALFLHFMEPQECFNCLYAMLRCKDNRYLTQTKVAVDASRLVMRDLAKHHAKSAFAHIMRNTDGNPDPVFENWIWWVLRDLPFPCLVHIVDCFLYEGIKVLYRMALAILILFSKYSSKSQQQSSNTKAAIRHFCEEMPFKVEKLLKTAFGIRGLGKKEMQKLQVRHEMYTKSQTVRMSRAQSFARSGSRSSFSGVPPSRSFSVPGPLVLKKSKRKNEVVSQDLLLSIWSWLPARFTICQPQLLYTSEEHGISLRTLYSRVAHHEPTLLIIKTTKDEIFGAFCSTDWKQRSLSKKSLSYFGTGETFIFSLFPDKVAYEWVGLYKSGVPATGSMFQAGDNHVLIIGGGNGVAIQLDEGFGHCRTEACDTFENSPLTPTEDFSCKVVEVFGFK